MVFCDFILVDARIIFFLQDLYIFSLRSGSLGLVCFYCFSCLSVGISIWLLIKGSVKFVVVIEVLHFSSYSFYVSFNLRPLLYVASFYLLLPLIVSLYFTIYISCKWKEFALIYLVVYFWLLGLSCGPAFLNCANCLLNPIISKNLVLCK